MSLSVLRLGFGVFLTLFLTAIIFFTFYFLVLILTKEKLTLEISTQIVDSVFQKIGVSLNHANQDKHD